MSSKEATFLMVVISTIQQGYSRNFNRPNGNFTREENPRDQSSSRTYNSNQQEGLNVNNEVATQHIQENKKVSNPGVSIQELPQ